MLTPPEAGIIGNYKLDKTIGQGTYGKVKLGVDIRTKEKVKS
jgi:serine/threonine protein kinase